MGKYEPGPSLESLPPRREKEIVDPKKESVKKANYFDWAIHKASVELAKKTGSNKEVIASGLREILEENELYEELFANNVPKEKASEALEKAYSKKFSGRAA